MVASNCSRRPSQNRRNVHQALTVLVPGRAAGDHVESTPRPPLLVVLDDLQWADLPSVRLLVFLAPLLHTAPLVVVGAYRDVDAPAGNALSAALPRPTPRRAAARALGPRSEPPTLSSTFVVPDVRALPRAASASLPTLCRHRSLLTLLGRPTILGRNGIDRSPLSPYRALGRHRPRHRRRTDSSVVRGDLVHPGAPPNVPEDRSGPIPGGC